MIRSSFVVFVLVSHYFVKVTPAWCSSGASGCSFNQVCCNHECQFGSSCVGLSCTSQNDCGITESCCNNVCTAEIDCSGLDCSSDLDCGQPNILICCNGVCQYDCFNWNLIIGLISGLLAVIFIITMCIFCACRRRRTVHRGRIIVGQRVTRTTTIRSAPASTQPYPTQAQPYQQGHPYYPPPQYEQHQTNRPPPYNLGPSTASEQPPPYTEGPQGGAGRIYTPIPSYGAVASAPPM